MKKRVSALIMTAALALGLLGCAILQTQQRLLAAKLIRLHVVANSDSAADQAIKLHVRDAVLQAAAPYAAGAEPEQALCAHLDELEEAARAALRACGQDTAVAVTLQNEAFPTREYETFALPAGVYRTLRVTIGAGAGHNWWCVVFPSICTAASMADFDAAAAAGGFTSGEVQLITGADEGYVLKFRILELLEALKSRLRGAPD